ncbi:FAD-dependent oxidoreductase [Povalibacter sp.]|uniref:FAD-dependent oxidoreductase n=1 Tax=Povalibacter sp. TaxID=1962978 RepID=UPI002F41B26A
MPKTPSIAVVGCGIFGAMTAMRLSERCATTTVFERQDAPLRGASFNNQNRLHLGFHYPRDDETARQCIRGFQRFRDAFPECVLDGFTNAYFIAREGSFVTPEQYLAFCRRMGLRHEQVDPSNFSPPVRQVALGVTCDEVVYDCGILRGLVLDRLTGASIRPHFGQAVTRIIRDGARFLLEAGGRMEGPFDAVVNCTYADVNRLTEQLGHVAPKLQYEYTMVPILEWDRPPVGITVMDGPFMTVLPFGRTGRFLLYHVAHTVVERHVGDQMPETWLDPSNAPPTRVDAQALFERMRETCSTFVPELAQARLTGFLHGPRVVLANRDSTDARPSIIQRHEDRYISVFTGKIDHCMWVADDVSDLLLSTRLGT